MTLTKLGKFTIILFFFWVSVVSYIALASIPFNPLSLPLSKTTNLNLIIPQGWGFFTRNPLEPTTLLYQRTINNNYSLFSKSNGDPDFLFGLSRVNRRISVETAIVLSEVNDSAWYKGEPNKLEFNLPKITIVKDPIKNPLLHGEYYAIKQDRIPWAWSNNYRKIIMPYKIIRLYVQ